ncbi:hypothetical protein [Dactylosporangium sp. CS-033363]|uniref:hypothetical protein n=1 Tax=Dactylosporangium sp. CS-033363 TaxID=3239935 RepID=UPI003D93C5A0
MTTSSEGGQPQPEADDQLDLSAERPTWKGHEPPLQGQDELRGEAVLTPGKLGVSWVARVRGDLGPVVTYAIIVGLALLAFLAVAMLGRGAGGPSLLVLLIAVAVGAGVLIAGITSCKPSTSGKRG